jgi:hypothetical protein
MNKAIILHSFLRLARPGTLMTLVMFMLVYPTSIIALISRMPSASFDFDALSNLVFGPMMINIVAFTFVSSSIGNTKSLDDGEYLGLLFSRPIFRWNYIMSKWLAGFILVVGVVAVQVIVFIGLLNLIGRGDQLSVGFIDMANIVLNSLQATALVVMIFAFPARIGAMLFAGLLYIALALPLMFNAMPDSAQWFNGNLQNIINFGSGCVRSFTYSPIDLGPYFNSIQILWLPVITFISNVALYLWIAIIVLNNREFFYTN